MPRGSPYIGLFRVAQTVEIRAGKGELRLILLLLNCSIFYGLVDNRPSIKIYIFIFKKLKKKKKKLDGTHDI